MTDAIPNASLPPSLILEVTSVFNLGKHHAHHKLVHGRSQPNFYLKTDAGPFVLSLREVTRISCARKPQVWLSQRNKACPLRCGATRDTVLLCTNSLTEGASRLRNFAPADILCPRLNYASNSVHIWVNFTAHTHRRRSTNHTGWRPITCVIASKNSVLVRTYRGIGSSPHTRR